MKAGRDLAAQALRERIHDEVGPRLFSVASQLSLMKRDLRGRAKEEVDAVLREVEDLRQEVRRMAEGDRVDGPEDLAVALADLARELGGVFCDVSSDAVKEPDRIQAILGIAREAAQNAVEHGRAQAIRIRLGDGFLSVEDNGKGMKKGWQPGLGMELMRQRARSLRGRVTLQRVAKDATVLACHFKQRKK